MIWSFPLNTRTSWSVIVSLHLPLMTYIKDVISGNRSARWDSSASLRSTSSWKKTNTTIKSPVDAVRIINVRTNPSWFRKSKKGYPSWDRQYSLTQRRILFDISSCNQHLWMSNTLSNIPGIWNPTPFMQSKEAPDWISSSVSHFLFEKVNSSLFR